MAKTAVHAGHSAGDDLIDITGQGRQVRWLKRMSDHVAYALLVYTGLHIFLTMGAIKGATGSILPYFGLVVLVAAIIPACRTLERRWERKVAAAGPHADLSGDFARDLTGLWLCAIGLPLLLTLAASAIF